MKLGIMQPYFLPYIGYWQLINAVDTFVIYDNIQYTKKGWINRNRILQNGRDAYITLPLKNDSDFLDVRKRYISQTFDRAKLLKRIQESYLKSPHFSEAFYILMEIINCDYSNLFEYIFNSIITLCRHFSIKTQIIISSNVAIDHNLKAENKVMAICKELCAGTYINAIGGQSLYTKDWFKENSVKLEFIKTDRIEYPQFGNEFIPWLSILDVMMFNSQKSIKDMMNKYTLV